MLDETAWLFNLRGSDVECNPVFVSYASVAAEGPTKLYVDKSKITPEADALLKVLP
jgi:Xaa-Pro aminopeptidase